ncbi:MAG: formate--phosphoribosylaminoimidazolecarboxamide ligase family protein [Candidatus Verstraetearchaeota archaeon]|nr:formate--phosphoribosylaminoimidazolecarboxamide ligase family protein [Candidatus Verstraetearchaeota archaeon]
MITRERVWELVDGYEPRAESLTIGTLGSHSALDIADGAKEQGFRTVVVCQKGRELPYKTYRRVVDHTIVLEKFSEIASHGVQEELRRRNTLFVPHRAFSTYVSYEVIEEGFLLPIIGNRMMLRSEERWAPKNQYYLLEKAGIRQPRKFRSPSEIDTLAIVKVQEAKRKIERAFFTAMDERDFWRKVEERVSKGIITREDAEKAVIEEYVVGTYFNFNYFYSPLSGEVEFMGIDRRLQTNLHDFVSLPAKQQLDIDIPLQNIEIGHMGATIRESMLEKVLENGIKFAKAAMEEYPPGIIGPFALQGAVNKDQEIVIFDVSPRVPGSPVIGTTSPYARYLYGRPMSVGQRIALEVKEAIETNRLKEIVT